MEIVMKKFTILLLVLSLCLGLCSCGKKTDSGEGGSVYYLNFKPESDSAWQALAKRYTEKTGVEVKVVTAAAGAYNETLTAEMGKSSAPTLFQCGTQTDIETWGDFCLDLSDTDVYKQMTTSDFNLRGKNGETLAIAYCYEAFGIIVNKPLLAKAGYKVEDIKNFDTLKAVAEDITARRDELKFAAFTSSGLDASSSWRFAGHLTNIPLYYEFEERGITEQPAEITGEYLNYYKNVWDLYINNSTAAKNELAAKTADEAEAEFAEGRAVFFQNGTWEYSALTEKYGMKGEDLAMIPIYCGAPGEENSALCCGTENCWAVNSNASEADQRATLDFINWVVTSDEGTEMMAAQFGPIPFKAAKDSDNVFFTDANRYIEEGKYVLTWAFNYTPGVEAWRGGLVSALMRYSAGDSDFSAVESAFVDGWKNQYIAENG